MPLPVQAMPPCRNSCAAAAKGRPLPHIVKPGLESSFLAAHSFQRSEIGFGHSGPIGNALVHGGRKSLGPAPAERVALEEFRREGRIVSVLLRQPPKELRRRFR